MFYKLRKSIKKALKILSVFILILMGAVVLAWSSMRSPLVQTQIANQITAALSRLFGADVSVGKARYSIGQGLTLQRLLILCPNGDTLLYVPQLSGHLKNVSLDDKIIDIQDFIIAEPIANIARTDSNYNFQFLIDAFARNDTSKTRWNINMQQIALADVNLTFDDRGTLHHLTNLNVEINGLMVCGENIRAQLNSLTTNYNSQPMIDNFHFDFVLMDKLINVDNFNFEARNSKVHLQHADVDIEKDKNLIFNAMIDSIKLCPADFAEVVPYLKNKSECLMLVGNLNGDKRTIVGKNITAQFNDNDILSADFKISNLNDKERLNYELKIAEIKSTTADVLTILSEYTKADTSQLRQYLSPLKTLWFSGNVDGTLSDIDADGKLRTGIGNLDLHAAMSRLDNGNFNVNGKLKSTPIELSAYVGVKTNLRIDLQADGQIGQRGHTNDTKLNIIGSVNNIEYATHTIDSISINGLVEQRMFSGRLCSFDPNLRFDFDGLVNYGDSSSFNFQTFVYYADLYQLGVTNDTTANISFNIKADFHDTNLDIAEGQIDLTDIFYFRDSSFFATDTVRILATNTDSTRILQLQSEFVQIKADGKYRITQLPSSIRNFAYKFMAGKTYTPPVNNNQFKVQIIADYPHPLTGMFLPWLNIASGTTILGSYDEKNEEFELNLISDDIIAKSFDIDHLKVAIYNADDSLKTDISADYLYFANYESMRWLNLQSTLFNDEANLNINWDNLLEKGRNSGDINAKIQFIDYDNEQHKTYIDIQKSLVNILDTQVVINPSSIMIADSAVNFGNISIDIDNGASSIFADGTLSNIPDDSLLVNINKLNLDFVSNIFGLKTHLSGIVSGKSLLKDLQGEKRIDGNVGIADFGINNQRFGNVKANAAWDMEQKLLLVDGALLDSLIDSHTAISGYIDPKRFYMNLDGTAEHQDVQFLKLFLSGVFSEMSGSFSGNMHAEGKLTAPNWYGKLALENTKLVLKPTKAVYSLNDTLEFTDNKILFKNVEGDDFEKGKLLIDGEIWHQNFKEFFLDLKINCNEIVGLNTKYSDSPMWYGKTYCSGIIDINGSTRSEINIDISARTLPKSMFYLTMEGRSDLSENNFITFVNENKISNIREVKKKKQELMKAPSSVLNLNLDLRVTRDAEVQIVFDPTIGDALRANGSGDINIRLNNNKFSIYGTYLIDKGNFTFTLQNIISKKLDLQSGSYVTWMGEPLGAIVNIDAAYKLRKVPVYSLTLDEEDREKRVPVNCHLLMSNKLTSPTINFSIDVPSTTSNVEVVEQLNNLPEDELNQQVIYLLMLNKFAPLTSVSAQNSTTSGGTVSASTASELLSNQLSKWISQLSTNFDLGVAYRPETEISSEEYELALSTTLWDDRIIVNSNFDMSGTNETTENSGNQYTTDISFELKLNKKGNVRLRAFQKVNDDLIYDDAPYTRGLGLFYTEDFNDFGELLHRWFRRRVKEAKKEESAKLTTDKLDN